MHRQEILCSIPAACVSQHQAFLQHTAADDKLSDYSLKDYGHLTQMAVTFELFHHFQKFCVLYSERIVLACYCNDP